MADVKKSAFSLSSATIMVGRAFVDDVFALTPEDNSVGMVSEVQVGLDSQITELLNGVQQVTVDAKRTGVSGSITGNVYEFTAQNFAYAQAMSGAVGGIKRGVLTATLASGAATMSVNSAPIPGEAGSAITALGDIPSGSSLLIQRRNGETDYVFPTKSSAAATGTGPYTIPIADPFDIPTGMSFAVGDYVWIVPPVGVGDMDADDLFCVKIAGVLTNYDRPVVYIAPKVRMVRGFQLAFNETAYGSMPWEMKPLIMSSGEAASMPRLSEIGSRRTGMLYVGG